MGAGFIGEIFGVQNMFYVSPNFKTKKALKEAVSAGQSVSVFAPGLGTVPENGTTAVGGPHFPKPHTWYAQVELKDGKVVKVK